MRVKKINSAHLPLLLLFVFFLSFCSDKKIEEQTAVQIYVENLVVEEKYMNNTDSLNIKKAEIFKKHNTSSAAYERFFRDLNDDVKKWESFFKKADDYLTELRNNDIIY